MHEINFEKDKKIILFQKYNFSKSLASLIISTVWSYLPKTSIEFRKQHRKYEHDHHLENSFIHPHPKKLWENYKQFINRFFIGFPDVHQTLLDIIAEENRVVMYFKYTGTHTGAFMGVAPTGKKITLRAIVTWSIVDGKIVEKGTQVWDFMDMYKQLGIIEYTEYGKKLFPQK